MAVLESYMTPSQEELEAMELDQAEKLDKVNKEIHVRNKALLIKARDVLLEIDPANRRLKGVTEENVKAPVSIVEQVVAREASAEE